MTRFVAMGALVSTLILALSAGGVYGEVSPRLDREMGVLAEAKEMQREINIHNLYNGLHFDLPQMQRILGLAREAEDLRGSLFDRESGRISQIRKIYGEILDVVRRGEPISPSLEAMGGLMEIAQKRLRKKYFVAMEALEKRVWQVLTPAQREVFRTYEPCLIPPRNIKDPVRVGQAQTYEGEAEILALARKVMEKDFDRECRRLLSVHMGSLEKFLGPMLPKVRKREMVRMLAVCRRARGLSEMDFALQSDDLARELGLHAQKDRFKEKAKGFIDLITRYQGGRIGEVANHFLDPVVIGVLMQRIERVRRAPGTPKRDLGSKAAPDPCKDGSCGRDPTKEPELGKKKIGITDLCRLLGITGEKEGAFRRVWVKAKKAQTRVLGLPMKGGGTPLTRILKIKGMPFDRRQAAVAELFAKLSEPIPGRESSHLEYLLWIKIGMDRQFRRILTPAQYGTLMAQVEDFLDHIVDDKEARKPRMADLVRRLGLSETKAHAATRVVREGQTRAWKIMSLPDASGQKPIDILLSAMTLSAKEKEARLQAFFVALQKPIPGRSATYAQEVERIKGEVRDALGKILTGDQMARFQAMHLDILDIEMED